MPPITSILCPVDFSPHSQRTLRHALAIAGREAARLTVLHVLEPLLVQAAAMTYNATYLQEEAERELRVLLTTTGTGGLQLQPPPAVLVRIGLPHAQILEVSQAIGADLIVAGTQGQTGAVRVFFGSTVARVLRETTVPALTIGPGGRTLVAEGHDGARLQVSRIVAGIDFGEMTEHTVRAAAQLASRWHCTLELLHAVDEAHGMDLWRRLVDEHQRHRVARAEKELNLLADEVRGSSPSIVIRTAIGTPELVLAEAGAAHEHTLIVLGLRSRQGVVGQQPGSIAYRVLSLSEGPVLVLPPPPATRKLRRG